MKLRKQNEEQTMQKEINEGKYETVQEKGRIKNNYINPQTRKLSTNTPKIRVSI